MPRASGRLARIQWLWVFVLAASSAHAQGRGDLLVGGLTNPTALAVDDTHVYWTESPAPGTGRGRVRRALKTGGAGETLVDGVRGLIAIAVDATHVYFNNNNPSGTTGGVHRIRKAGGPIETVARATTICSFVIHAGFVYFSACDAGEIRRAPVAGGAAVTLATSAAGAKALTAAGGHVYWIQLVGEVYRIMSVPLAGGAHVAGLAVDSLVNGFALDATTLFWPDNLEPVAINRGRLWRTHPLGAILLRGGLPRITDVVNDERMLFFIDNHAATGSLRQITKWGDANDLTGGDIELAAGLDEPHDPAVDATHVYWVERANGVKSMGTVRRTAKGVMPDDTVPPETTITGGPGIPNTLEPVLFRWTGTDNATIPALLTFAWKLDPIAPTFTEFLPITETSLGPLPAGTYTLTVKARDAFGTEDPTPATRTFTVLDGHPPETFITAGPTGLITARDVAFAWTGVDNEASVAELQYAHRLDPIESSFSAFGPATSRSYTSLPNGSYTLYVKARDVRGNEDQTPAAQSFQLHSDTDELADEQWHLSSRSLEPGGANVRAAWLQSTGAGVVIGVVDDGLQRNHPDLAANFQAALSFDFNENDADPSPSEFDWHGTAAAGVAAARGTNGIGVSGVAPLAGLAGLRLISRPASDAEEASALAFADQEIAISTNSWGPSDDARTMSGPGPLAEAAIESAATQGRGGLGRIFVWAAGNGGAPSPFTHDHCGFDGYATQRFVMSVGAVDDFGQQAWYSEACPALFVTAPSNGGMRGITTTDLVGPQGYNPAGDYTNTFGGTSGATPIVAGVAALMLERNPSLSWRDVQEIIAQTAVRASPFDPGWTPGPYPHNQRYGFGLVDAARAVDTAATWVNLPAEQAVPETTHTLGYAIPDYNDQGVTDSITVPGSFANFLVEHVEVEFDANHDWRGDLRVDLISPTGVVSNLAITRSNDRGAPDGHQFVEWKFRSVRHWGERAAGTWTLRVADVVTGLTGTWNHWRLRIWGRPAPVIATAAMSANLAAPQAAGTTVTFTASATGGLAPRQFKWWVHDGVSWRVAQNWSTSETFAWTPLTPNAAHLVAVWVRSAGSTVDAVEGGGLAQMAFPITAGPPATLQDVLVSHASPQMIGQPITFTAVGAGGIAPRQYKFWLFDGATWSVAQDWSTNTVFVWTPSTPGSRYFVGVWVRSAASTQDAPDPGSRVFSIPFTITPAAATPVVVTSLSWDPPSPQPTGTTVSFVALATGGIPPLQYKWWVFDGSVWTVGREWSPANTFVWTPLVPSPDYVVAVWARQGGSSEDAPDNPSAVASTPYAIEAETFAPLAATGLMVDRASPQPLGAGITFTALVSGGTGPLQFKWWVFDGLTWQVGQDWSTSATFPWSPAAAGSGYVVAFWARSSGNLEDGAENNTLRQVSFVISP